MTPLTSPKASFIILIGRTASPEEVLQSISHTAAEHPYLALTLGFPTAWLPRTRVDLHHFPSISQNLWENFCDLSASGIINLASTGFSGAPEIELSTEALEIERSWIQKNPWTSTHWRQQEPIILPTTQDFHRPWTSKIDGIYLEGLSGGPTTQWAAFSRGKSMVSYLPIRLLHSPELKSEPKYFIKLLHRVANHTPPDDGIRFSQESPPTPVFVFECNSIEDAEKLNVWLLDIQKWNGESKKPFFWQSLPEAIHTGLGVNQVPHDSTNSLFPYGWLNHPWINYSVIESQKKPSTGQNRIINQLNCLTQPCNTEEIPVQVAPPPMERELIASMLGNANLVGDAMEIMFHDGKLDGIIGTFGGTRGSGIRVPTMEIENQRIHWSIESAFSFETDTSRGLRQIAVLSSDLFTLSGRIVSDYVFFDDYPGLIIDIRIQHPWIEKNYRIDSYLPWLMNVWTIPSDKSFSVTRYPSEKESFHQPILHPKKGQPNRRSGIKQLFQKNSPILENKHCLPGTHWDAHTQEGTLRIRRADSLVYSQSPIPGIFITSPGTEKQGVSFCPTRSYSGIPARSIQGIQEHFGLILYDPVHEKEILTTKKIIRDKIFTPWVIRS